MYDVSAWGRGGNRHLLLHLTNSSLYNFVSVNGIMLSNLLKTNRGNSSTGKVQDYCQEKCTSG